MFHKIFYEIIFGKALQHLMFKQHYFNVLKALKVLTRY